MNSFVYPEYQGKSFLNIPSTILSLFGALPLKPTLPGSFYSSAVSAEKVILLIVDGLGYNLFCQKALALPFFKKLTKKGIFNQITAVFPSTTAAAISTINCGLPPVEHGLPEWYVYFEEIDAVLESLPFTPVYPEDLEKTFNPPADILFDQKTIYERLGEIKIPSFVFAHKSYSGSLFNAKAASGSTPVPYATIADLMVALRKVINQVPGKAYLYVYWPAIDSSGHQFGPYSEEVETEISLLDYMLKKELIDKIDPKVAEKVALLTTADHGQVPVDPGQTFYLDLIPLFGKLLKLDKRGRVIPPTGGSRDVFLNIKEDLLPKATALLKKELQGLAEVLTVEQAIEKGVFGEGKMHPKFLSRVGNLLLLPYGHQTIWYHYTPDQQNELLGHHGGLSEEEMLIPFISTKVSDLK